MNQTSQKPVLALPNDALVADQRRAMPSRTDRLSGSLRATKNLLERVIKTFKARGDRPERCKERLVMARSGEHILDREIAIAADVFPCVHESWITYFLDPANVVSTGCGQLMATRAITTDGQLFWLCESRSQRKLYHSLQCDPLQAIDDATRVWSKRKKIRREWAKVEAFAVSLRCGESVCEVTRKDLENSVLCRLGVEGFLSTFGLSARTSLSGRVAALLMKIEPQVGYVLHQVLEREGDNISRTN